MKRTFRAPPSSPASSNAATRAAARPGGRPPSPPTSSTTRCAATTPTTSSCRSPARKPSAASSTSPASKRCSPASARTSTSSAARPASPPSPPPLLRTGPHPGPRRSPRPPRLRPGPGPDGSRRPRLDLSDWPKYPRRRQPRGKRRSPRRDKDSVRSTHFKNRPFTWRAAGTMRHNMHHALFFHGETLHLAALRRALLARPETAHRLRPPPWQVRTPRPARRHPPAALRDAGDAGKARPRPRTHKGRDRDLPRRQLRRPRRRWTGSRKTPASGSPA
jgi:hypothetical protein